MPDPYKVKRTDVTMTPGQSSENCNPSIDGLIRTFELYTKSKCRLKAKVDTDSGRAWVCSVWPIGKGTIVDVVLPVTDGYRDPKEEPEKMKGGFLIPSVLVRTPGRTADITYRIYTKEQKPTEKKKRGGRAPPGSRSNQISGTT